MKKITATLVMKLFFAAIAICFSTALSMFFWANKVRDYREAMSFAVFGLLIIILVLALIKGIKADLKAAKKNLEVSK